MTEFQLISTVVDLLGWPRPVYQVAELDGNRFPYYQSIVSESTGKLDRLHINVKPRFLGWAEVDRFGIFAGYYKFDLAEDGSTVREVVQLLSPVWHRNWFTTRRSARAHLSLFPEHLKSAPGPNFNGLDDPRWPRYVRTGVASFRKLDADSRDRL